jgi:hypothetical protein
VVPVCGCNGHVYNNVCEAGAAGQDVSSSGGCTPPTGMFACGSTFCAKGTQYCEAMVGGAVSNPGSYACHSFPAACGATPTCSCLTGAATCGNCTMSAAGDLTTSCLFP